MKSRVVSDGEPNGQPDGSVALAAFSALGVAAMIGVM